VLKQSYYGNTYMPSLFLLIQRGQTIKKFADLVLSAAHSLVTSRRQPKMPEVCKTARRVSAVSHESDLMASLEL
jgi:hypothetical protein